MNTIKFEVPNLNKMIEKTLNDNFSYEKIQAVINKCCSDVIESDIKSQFSYSGKVRHQLEEFVKNKIDINTDLLPVPEYTNLVAEGFKNALIGMEDEEIKKKAEDLLKSILQQAPKEIKLSELAKQYIDEISDKYEYELKEINKECDYDGDEVYKSFEIQYDIEEQYPDSSCLNNYKILTFQSHDIDDDSHRLLLDVKLQKDGTALLSAAMRDKKHSSNIGQMEMKSWHRSSSFHQLLYKMIHRGTEIIMDEKEIPEDFKIKLDLEYN